MTVPCRMHTCRFSSVASRTRIARLLAGAVVLSIAGCAAEPEPPPPQVVTAAPADSQHAGITEPHGDHTPHHGGMVLMNGDVHYEVILDPSGHHAVWFTDAIREDLPAAVARNVRMRIARPDEPEESLTLQIDESGESWIASGQPVSGPGVIVSLAFEMGGEPHAIDLPFVASTK